MKRRDRDAARRLKLKPIDAAIFNQLWHTPRRPGAGDFHVVPPRRHLLILSVDGGACIPAPVNPPTWPETVQELTKMSVGHGACGLSEDTYNGSASDTLHSQGHRS